MKHRIYYIASSCIIFEKCLCPPLLFEICFITSRPDKTLLPVDISHRISSSQLNELVRSVICQQVLRLCQTQQHKRQPSKKKKKKRQNSRWRRSRREGEASSTAVSTAFPLQDSSVFAELVRSRSCKMTPTPCAV